MTNFDHLFDMADKLEDISTTESATEDTTEAQTLSSTATKVFSHFQRAVGEPKHIHSLEDPAISLLPPEYTEVALASLGRRYDKNQDKDVELILAQDGRILERATQRTIGLRGGGYVSDEDVLKSQIITEWTPENESVFTMDNVVNSLKEGLETVEMQLQAELEGRPIPDKPVYRDPEEEPVKRGGYRSF